ncbi:unnamed protein product, partial [Urochloa humidicola]
GDASCPHRREAQPGRVVEGDYPRRGSGSPETVAQSVSPLVQLAAPKRSRPWKKEGVPAGGERHQRTRGAGETTGPSPVCDDAGHHGVAVSNEENGTGCWL